MNKEREMLLLSIFTFLTVFLWIVFELTKTAKTTTISPTTQKLLTPFDPSLDMDVFTQIAERN